jgi:uncharacterized protein (DUF952 family)
VILHLLPRRTWEEVRGDTTYLPESFEADGFVHCSGDDEVLLAVANRFYTTVDDEVAVLTLDEALLASEVRWEAADPGPPPGVDPGTMFPHVYGPLELAAVVDVRVLSRDGAGRFVGYEPTS